jgi:hypothetical protein
MRAKTKEEAQKQQKRKQGACPSLIFAYGYGVVGLESADSLDG